MRSHASKILPYLSRPNGKFVEIGAGDGIKGSFTLYLEKALGWEGLLVEPWPHLYQRCRKKRENSLVLNVAAVDKWLEDSYIEIKGMPPEASIRRELKREAKERMVGRTAEAPLRAPKKQRIHYVSTNSIDRILSRNEFDNDFDLLVLNLSGYEGNALEGMDFETQKPTFVLARVSSETKSIPNLPVYYEPISSSKHDDSSYLRLFRYSDFGSN